MIFGKTYAERGKRWQEIMKQRFEKGTTHFAFLPKRLQDGRWVWLRRYYKHWLIQEERHVDCSTNPATVSCWYTFWNEWHQYDLRDYPPNRSK